MVESAVILICLIINALLAAYEMAFVAVPKPELRALARKGNKNALKLLSLRENPERTLSIIQVGITLVGSIAAAVGGIGASDLLQPYFVKTFGFSDLVAESLAVVLVVLPITFLAVVVGELVPKTLALRNPAKILLAGAFWLFFFDRYLAPLVRLFETSTKFILRIFFRKSRMQASAPETAIEIDALSPTHQKFMLNLSQIEKKRIKEILLPWAQVVSVASTSPMEEVKQTILASGHTRLPVTSDDKVLGILHAKEFLAFRETGESNWQPLVRPVILVQTMNSALGIMRTLQESKNHMAVVVSPIGEKLGIVTLEDIFEEIVGDIYDEDDDEKVRRIYVAKTKARFIRREP